ncbi:hypothetical protein Tco_0403446 [Tanacetum coccineum]
MILESLKNGPLIWPMIEENRVTRPRKYSELSATDAIQADYDLAKVNNHDNMDNNIINQAVQAMPSSEQSSVVKSFQRLNNRSQQLEPKLYDGNDIKNTSGIVILDSKETLMLSEESHSKMLLKQQDPMVLEKKVNTKRVVSAAVEQHRLESKTFEVKMNQVLNENERLLEQVINKDIVNIIMNSTVDNAFMNVKSVPQLWNELLNKKDFIEKETYDKLFRSYTTLEKHYISLEEKDLVITALKDELRKLKGKDLADNEEATILREIVEHEKSQNPLKESLDSALAVTPKNKDKRVKFIKPITYLGNTNTKTASSSNFVSNKPMLSSTGVKPSTSASGSQPSGNTKKDKIQRTPSSTQKNKVEAHPKTIKSSLRNKNCFVESKGNANVQHSNLNANSEPLCVKCNGCMLFDNHDLCVLNFINDVNARTKSKSVKKIGNACPLTRITITAEVPLRNLTALESDTPKLVVTLVYSRKPKKSKTNDPVSKPKNIKSLSSNKKELGKSWGSIISDVPSSSLDE